MEITWLREGLTEPRYLGSGGRCSPVVFCSFCFSGWVRHLDENECPPPGPRGSKTIFCFAQRVSRILVPLK